LFEIFTLTTLFREGGEYMSIKKVVGGLAILSILALTTFPAFAASPRPNRTSVMSATPDTYNASWVTGVSQDGGPKGQSIKLTSTQPDIAYYSFRNWWNQKLSDIRKVRASWLLQGANSGGSPRFSLELDADANGTFDENNGDVVVYLDPATCSVPATDGWIESDFVGNTTNCTITDSSGATYASDSTGTAWSKLVAAYPNAKVWFMFVIQDATSGTNYVDRIMLDSAFFTKAP